ncbi:hypothetical protein RD792_010624 [Penstemon davidsonii]|uniref:Peroxisomal membrane protein PEX16 n=1 Tax=Penstemon davidsonii TaxID=160366 RepID=A0ABR0D2M1_9LAMI|nr:hypothetical protein RD792_010624 [Penstemon davidsonii]
MEAYKRWVRRNKDYVHSLESLANGLTWLLPERFSESEIGPEADLETLVEVVAQQLYGEERKWNFIAITEAIKAILRLEMLRISGYKMLLHGGENVNDGNDPDDAALRRNELLLKPPHGKNLEGRAVSALSRFGQNARYGARSWFPWVTSLAVDLIGNGIISFVTISRRNSESFCLSNLEKNELRRRKMLWALYLMRDPFFTNYTRQKLDVTQKLVEPVPIIGILTEKLVELLVGAQTRYTYMSGS